MADIDETDTILVLADGQAAFCGQAQEMRKEFGSPGMTLEDVFVAMYRRKFL